MARVLASGHSIWLAVLGAQSGGVVRGNVCFTVRASDIDSLVLLDNQSSDNDRLYFLLK